MVLVSYAKREQIEGRLREIERAADVRILYACESGRRAWGFPSADSDYDVRFIYAHPAEWYLSLDNRRDVIELPLEGDLDINGWDVRKALNLFRKSNPPLLEWLQSPIVYVRVPGFAERLQELMPAWYAPRSCMHHYLHMAQGNMREYLAGERVWVKKYFYVLRPVLACLWIERGFGPVPTEFLSLVDRVVPTGALRDAIDELVEKKREGQEMDEGARIPIFHEFIETQIARLEDNIQAGPARPPKPGGAGELDGVFRDIIGFPRQMPRPGFTGVRRYDGEPPVDDSALHDNTCPACHDVREWGSPAALDEIVPDSSVGFVIRVFDVFSDSRYSRNRVGGRVLHVLRQLARKAHRVYVLKMDCHKRPRIYHEHAIHWFPTIRVYAHGRQVECPRLRSIFPKTWSVFVQPRPQESDLDKLGIDGVLPADFEWTMVEDEGIRILTRAVRQGRAEEARRFRKLREAEENRLQQGGERVIPAASSGANEAADATLAEWSLARRRPLPTSALLGAVESRLHEAARTEKEVAIRYQGGSTPGETRRILPKELFAVEGFPRVYVLAHDVAKNEARVFRLDRISLA